MSRIEFEEIIVTATKTITVNGKQQRRQKTFRQTENPWNTNEHGAPKTRQEIYADLSRQAAEWRAAKDEEDSR